MRGRRDSKKAEGVHVREGGGRGTSTFNLLEQLLDLVLAPVAVYVHPQQMVLREGRKEGKARQGEDPRTVESALSLKEATCLT